MQGACRNRWAAAAARGCRSVWVASTCGGARKKGKCQVLTGCLASWLGKMDAEHTNLSGCTLAGEGERGSGPAISREPSHLVPAGRAPMLCGLDAATAAPSDSCSCDSAPGSRMPGLPRPPPLPAQSQRLHSVLLCRALSYLGSVVFALCSRLQCIPACNSRPQMLRKLYGPYSQLPPTAKLSHLD